MTRILFILKRREDYNAEKHSHIGLNTGLYNSANFMHEMLRNNGIETKLFVAIDNNCIDREVTQYKPDIAIIEALWVVPTKFAILKKLHPNVTWIIRLHSELPFMAGEGMAMDWIGDYSMMKDIIIAANAPRMLHDIRMYLQHRNTWSDEETAHKVIYLPNYYPKEYVDKEFYREKETVDIGCFGAIRPLKNHLVQAFGAIEFANKLGKKLNFHVNAGRIEMQGQPMLNNIKALFEQLYDTGHRLINHEWAPRKEFLKLCYKMDIGMQCNFSETFNIVGADFISQGVPLVGTKEIPWLSCVSYADPTDVKSIAKALNRAYNHPNFNVWINGWGLTRYTSNTVDIWVDYFKEKSNVYEEI